MLQRRAEPLPPTLEVHHPTSRVLPGAARPAPTPRAPPDPGAAKVSQGPRRDDRGAVRRSSFLATDVGRRAWDCPVWRRHAEVPEHRRPVRHEVDRRAPRLPASAPAGRGRGHAHRGRAPGRGPPSARVRLSGPRRLRAAARRPGAAPPRRRCRAAASLPNPEGQQPRARTARATASTGSARPGRKR